MTRPPLRNLSPMAEPWGRWIEDEVKFLGESVDRMGGDSSNDGRINNSSMDLMAAQINELNARRVIAAVMPDISAPGSGTLTLPGAIDGQLRHAWLIVTGRTTTSAANSYISATMSLNGNVFFHQISSQLSASYPEYFLTYTGSTGFISTPSNPGTLQIDIAGGELTSLRDIQVSVGFAQMV